MSLFCVFGILGEMFREGNAELGLRVGENQWSIAGNIIERTHYLLGKSHGCQFLNWTSSFMLHAMRRRYEVFEVMNLAGCAGTFGAGSVPGEAGCWTWAA